MTLAAGEMVSLVTAEPGAVICQRGNEVGKVPVDSCLLDLHHWTPDLAVVSPLVRCPEIFSRIVLEHYKEQHTESGLDLVVVLAASGELDFALFSLFSAEIEDNARRGVATETFRQATPAMALAGLVMRTPACRALGESFLSAALSCAERRRGRGGGGGGGGGGESEGEGEGEGEAVAGELASFLETSLERTAPPELVALMRALRRACFRLPDALSFLRSVLCLRFLCPALVRPSSGRAADPWTAAVLRAA